MNQQIATLLAASLLTCGCQKQNTPIETATAPEQSRFDANDRIIAQITENLTDFKITAEIDHARLAENEGVTMPPSKVLIYSDSATNTGLIKLNPRVGLDLPCKILAFEEIGQNKVAFPETTFLAARHAISDTEALARYEANLLRGLRGINREYLASVDASGITLNYGIIELTSDFSMTQTIVRLTEAVMQQGDTIWFGEIDFQAEALSEKVTTRGNTLLLFGGPQPGGVAMANFPKLGLDAFCQKLLIYEDDNGKVKVLFNDIVALAHLHYGTSAKPHEMLNSRLLSVFKTAITQGN